MLYFLYIFLAILPSIIWLVYFLRKDVHPEPNSQVLKVFFGGAIITLPALLIELGAEKALEALALPFLFASLVNIFLGVAFVEEILKYLVVRINILRSPEFDEPIDAMLYMIIVALGFAGVENILLFFKPGIFVEPFDPFLLSLVRFLGATFLHALCSATIGFFLAFSLFHQRRHLSFLIIGVGIATLLHGFYNFAIIEIEGPLKLYVIMGILMLLALSVSFGLKKLKRLKSICIQ